MEKLDFIAMWEPEKKGAKKPNWASMYCTLITILVNKKWIIVK